MALRTHSTAPGLVTPGLQPPRVRAGRGRWSTSGPQGLEPCQESEQSTERSSSLTPLTGLHRRGPVPASSLMCWVTGMLSQELPPLHSPQSAPPVRLPGAPAVPTSPGHLGVRPAGGLRPGLGGAGRKAPVHLPAAPAAPTSPGGEACRWAEARAPRCQEEAPCPPALSRGLSFSGRPPACVVGSGPPCARSPHV